MLSSGTHDDADQGNDVTSNEEPSPSKEIRQPSQDCVGEGQRECSRNVEPGDVLAGSNIFVDVCKNIGG